MTRGEQQQQHYHTMNTNTITTTTTNNNNNDTNTKHSSMGVMFELTPQVAQQLRRRRRRQPTQNETQALSLASTTSSSPPPPVAEEQQHQDAATAVRLDNNNNNDDDDGIKNDSNKVLLSQHDQELADKETHDNDSDDDASTVLSVTPPPSLPLLLVDAQRLIGYRPSTDAERQAVAQQITQALHSCTDNTTDFNQRTAELMESAVGRHLDTAQAMELGLYSNDNKNGSQGPTDPSTWPTAWTQQSSWILVEYPEYIMSRLQQQQQQQDGEQDKVVALSTRQLWKSLLTNNTNTTSSYPAVVQQLLRHVRDCSRPLLYKVQLSKAIRRLCRTEQAAARQRQEARQLQSWQTAVRPHELEKLYTVRETLQLQVQMAQERLQRHLNDREVQVAHKLRQARSWQLQQQQQQQGSVNSVAVVGGLQGLDFDHTQAVPLLPEEPFVFFNDETNEDHHGEREEFNNLYTLPQYNDDEDDNVWDVLRGGNDRDDDDDDLEQEALDSTNNHNDRSENDKSEFDKDAILDKNDATIDESATNLSTMQQPESKHDDAAQQEVAFRQKLATAQAQEDAMREACTTNECKTAMAIVKALEERLAKTDALLESLQEEEWAAQEQGEESHDGTRTTSYEDEQMNNGTDETKSGQPMTLLDQILAMVLGAIPTPVGGDDRQHLLWKQVEHETIVMDWKAAFGRLPPGASLEGERDMNVSSWGSSKVIVSSTSPPPSKAELKESLGIVDNGKDDWEEWDDWTDDDNEGESRPSQTMASESNRVKKEPTPKQPGVGLRPGGRAV